MLNSNEFGPTVVSNVVSNSVVPKIERSAAGNDFSLAWEEHAVVLLPWRDMARPALLSALAAFIREKLSKVMAPSCLSTAVARRLE